MRQRQFRLPRPLLLSALGLGVFVTFNWLPLFSQPTVAEAHAFVIGSDPVDGSTVNTMPRMVRIFFDEPISPASIAHVIEPDGKIVDASRSAISRTNAQELDTPLMTPDRLPFGSYTVRWSALSNEDGHATQGVIGFNVGFSSTGLPGEVILGPSTSNIVPELNLQGILAIAWEWLVLGALTLWVGILVMEGLVVERIERSSVFTSARKHSLPLQWLCLAALFVGEIINIILRATLLTMAQGNSGIDLLTIRQVILETGYGYLWLIRMGLIVMALGLLWWTGQKQSAAPETSILRQVRRSSSNFSRLRRQVALEQEPGKANEGEENGAAEIADAAPGSTQGPQGLLASRLASRSAVRTSSRNSFYWYTLAWLILAGLILLTLAPSDAAAQLAQPHISAIVLQWLYLSARCVWLGGAAYLGFMLLPLLPIIEPDQHAETLAILLRRYAPLMLSAIGVLLVSGLFFTQSSLSDAQQLVNDPYGRALLVKIFLFALMLIFSGYALFFLLPRLIQKAVLLPVVHAELPARRTRQSALNKIERSLKRIMNIVSWLGAGMLLCSALMAFFAPPIVFPAINYTATTASTPSQNMQTKQVGNLSVTLLVLPGRVNSTNTVILTMNDSKGNPVTDAQVHLSINMVVMDMGTTLATIKGGSPAYVATFGKDTTFTMGGMWDIVVTISRPHTAPMRATFQVMLTE